MRRRGLLVALAMGSTLVSLAATSPSPEPTPPPSPQPGDTVVVGNLGAVVPAPGETVIAYGDAADGTSERLTVQTLDDGTVLVNPRRISNPSAP